MKKFPGLIVLLVALAVCAAALVACNPSSGDQATPQSIQFEDKDGADRSTFWDLGIFDYGTAYADILPSFTLNLYYSDGSTKELAAGDYTVSYIKIEEEDVPLQSMPAVPDAGYYQIVFDKDELQARMIFTVNKDKKSIPAPTAHLRDSATDTDGVDFVTLDGAAHAIDFTNFTENAVYTTVNGESVYAIPETDNRAYYLLESETIAENIDSAGEWVVNVALTPAPEYTWEDGSVTPVEYTCKINAHTTFFPGIKVADAYTAFDPTNTTTDDEVMQLMNDWLGADGAGKMETDCRDYTAAVYFTAFRDGESLAQYIGTVSNSHTAADNFGTYSMSFALTNIANKSAPTHYHGATEVEVGSKVDSKIFPNDDPHFSVDKITDYDMPFFLIAKVDCREAVQSDNITFAYATFGDCTVVRMKGTGENSAEGTSTSSEVYMIFRGGEYVGHEIVATVTADGVSTDFFVQFALAR